MGLIVESITVSDFLSYAEPQTIMLAGRGPVAVVGENGSGKSTIVSKALSWGLYGSCAPERMGTSTKTLHGSDVIRRVEWPEHATVPPPKRASVTIRLLDSDADIQYEVSRVRPLSGGDKLLVTRFVSGDKETMGTDQSTVDNLIGVPYEVFTKTCLRGQGDPWNFAEATDKKKREILDAISGADKLIAAWERSIELRKKAERERDLYRTRAEDAERRSGASNVGEMEAFSDAWEQERARRLEAAQDECNTLYAEIAVAAGEDAKDREYDSRRKALGERPSLDREPYEDAIRKAGIAFSHADAALKHAKEAKIEADRLLADGYCPTCGTELKGADTLIHRHAAIDTAILEGSLDSTRTRLAECETAKRAAVEWERGAIAEWEAATALIPQPAAQPRELKARKAYELAYARWEEIGKSENPWKNTIARERNNLYSLQAEAATLRELERLLNREMGLAEGWETVLAPKGVRAHLSEGSLAAIEIEANKWLALLSDGKLSIRLSPTRETRDGSLREEIETAILVNGNERSLLSFSGGEKKRINLAVDLGVAAAFSHGGALALSLLVLDEEVFSGLDEQGKTATVSAFHAAGVADVIVIDHDPRLTGTLSGTIRVTRGKDGYSRVEEL